MIVLVVGMVRICAYFLWNIYSAFKKHTKQNKYQKHLYLLILLIFMERHAWLIPYLHKHHI